MRFFSHAAVGHCPGSPAESTVSPVPRAPAPPARAFSHTKRTTRLAGTSRLTTAAGTPVTAKMCVSIACQRRVSRRGDAEEATQRRRARRTVGSSSHALRSRFSERWDARGAVTSRTRIAGERDCHDALPTSVVQYRRDAVRRNSWPSVAWIGSVSPAARPSPERLRSRARARSCTRGSGAAQRRTAA